MAVCSVANFPSFISLCNMWLPLFELIIRDRILADIKKGDRVEFSGFNG
jgi:hypothetical protein